MMKSCVPFKESDGEIQKRKIPYLFILLLLRKKDNMHGKMIREKQFTNAFAALGIAVDNISWYIKKRIAGPRRSGKTQTEEYFVKRYVVESAFLVNRLTGVERVAIETLKCLDAMVQPGQLEILVLKEPELQKAQECLGQLQNISVRISIPGWPKHMKKSRLLWEQLYLPLYCLFTGRKMLGFANESAVLFPGIVCLHDILPLSHPEYFSDMRQVSRLKLRVSNWMIVHRAYRLVTDSEYSAREIRNYYHTNREIAVIGAGWNHVRAVRPDERVFQRLPQLRRGEYFFMLGSLSPRKNQKWFEAMAKKYPQYQFVRTGGQLARVEEESEALPNLFFTGYLSDSEINALMRDMKALLFPSYEEGFGLPPLEALALGRRALVARASCMPEIYRDTVAYFDPNDLQSDLDSMLGMPVCSPDALLQRYSWKTLAEMWLSVLTEDGRPWH